MSFWWRAARPAPAHQDTTDEEFARVLLDEGREELGRADGKAALLLSAAGILIAALLGGAIGGDWSPSDIENDLARKIFWVGVVVGGFGLVVLATAVKPVIRNLGPKERLAYFGDVVGFRERGLPWTKEERNRRGKENFSKALSKVSGSRLNRTIDQVWVVSAIVNKKYRRIHSALWCFGASVLFCTLALVANAKW